MASSVIQNFYGIEHENIINGLNAYKIGRICVLVIAGASSNGITLPVKFRPIQTISGVVRGTESDNKRQACLVTLTTSGDLLTSYFIPNTTTANTFNGTIQGELVYISAS